jgi:hypothetical protein
MAGEITGATPLNLSDLNTKNQNSSNQSGSAAPLSLSTVPGIYTAPAPLTDLQKFEEKVQSKVPQAQKEVAEHPWTSYIPNGYQLPLVGEPIHRAVIAGEAALGQGEGQTYAERQADLLAQSRARDIARHEAAPLSNSFIQGAAEAIPSIALAPELGVEAAASKAFPYIEKGAGYVGRMIEQGIYGGAGAAQQSTPGETAGDAFKRIALGATVGAAGVPVATVAGKVLQAPKATYNWASKLWDPEGAVARDIAAGAATVSPTAKGQGLTIEQYAAAKERGEPVTIADIQGAKPQIAKAAEDLPTDQRIQEINDSLQQRFNDSSSRIGEQVDTAFGKPIDAFQAKKEADELARKVNKPAYDAAYAQPIDYASPEGQNIESLIKDRVPASAIKGANDLMRLEGAPESKQIMAHIADNGTVKYETMPDVMQVDYITRALNDTAKREEGAGAMGGITQKGKAYQGLATDLRDNLRTAVPEYDTALNGAGKFIRGNNAHDEGMSFLDLISNKNADPKEVGSTLNNLEKVYTPDEKRLFGEGVAADIKENPVKAAKLFASDDTVTMDRLKSAIGDDAFNQIDSSMRINRIMALSKEIGKPTAAPLVSPKNIAIGAGSLGLSATAGAYLPKLVEALPNIAKYGADPMALTATGAALAAGFLGAGIAKAGNKAKSSAILGMALSNDPKYTDILLRAAKNDAEVRYILGQFERGLSRYLALNQKEPSRDGRKHGGAVIERKAEALINETMRNKKLYSDHTEHMLSMPDDAIVQALKVAKQVAA